MLQTPAQGSSARIIHQVRVACYLLHWVQSTFYCVTKDITSATTVACLQVVLTKVDKLRQGHVERVVLEVTKRMEDCALVFPQVFPVRYVSGHEQVTDLA